MPSNSGGSEFQMKGKLYEEFLENQKISRPEGLYMVCERNLFCRPLPRRKVVHCVCPAGCKQLWIPYKMFINKSENQITRKIFCLAQCPLVLPPGAQFTHGIHSVRTFTARRVNKTAVELPFLIKWELPCVSCFFCAFRNSE